jgi:hypothetical protein
MNDQGHTYAVTTAAGETRKTNVDTGAKRFGGVLIMGTELVITSDQSIIRKAGAAPTSAVQTRVRNRFTPTSPRSWEHQPEATPSVGR